MKINERIDLYAVFKKGKLIPIAFQWKKDKFIIDRIKRTYKKKVGLNNVMCYSVSVDQTDFKISINASDTSCMLNRIEVH